MGLAELKIYIVDDNKALCKVLMKLLEVRGYTVERYHSAVDFLSANIEEMRGCILLDVKMPVMDGLTLQEELKEKGVELPTIFMTGHATVASGVLAMKRGANNYIEKPFDPTTLYKVVEEGLGAFKWLEQELCDLETLRSRYHTLTPRERAVLTHVVEGKANKEVGAALDISERTVKAHRASVMTKMEAYHLPELVQMATKLGELSQ